MYRVLVSCHDICMNTSYRQFTGTPKALIKMDAQAYCNNLCHVDHCFDDIVENQYMKVK